MKSESPDISFNKGINQDIHPASMPEGSYYEATGVIMSSNEGMNGDTFALQNERGFTEYSDFKIKKPDHLIMGMFAYKDRIIVCSIKPSVAGSVITTLESEVGYIQNEVYTEVLNDTDASKNPSLSESFGFDIRYPIDGRFKPNFKNELVFYWVDQGLNPPRFLNLDLDYTDVNNVFVNLSQQTTTFELFNSPVVTYISTIEGGNVKPGLYHFAVRYLNKTLDPTTFGLLCNGIPVVDDGREVSRLQYDGADYQATNTSKAIELEITNLDEDFLYIEVAVLTYVGAISTPSAYIFKRERIKGATSLRIIFDGRVEESIAYSLLTETKPYYDTAKHIETKDNRLLYGNLSLNGQLNLHPIANAIRLKYKVEEIQFTENYVVTDGSGEYGLSDFDNTEATHPENYEAAGAFDDYKGEQQTFDKKGYAGDECYSFAIVGILKTGGYTEAFHIPAYYNPAIAMPDAGEYDNNGNVYTGLGNTSGYLNCFVSEDTYDDPDALYYFDHLGNSLHGQGIRHHLFPTHKDEPHYRIDTGVATYIRVKGVSILGLDDALIANPDLDSKLAGIILVREKRNTFSNRRVYAMGMLNRLAHFSGKVYNPGVLANSAIYPPTFIVNPLFGDTILEQNANTGWFNGEYNALHADAIKACAWYSPESVLTNHFTVPTSARIIPIFRVDANLREGMTGTNVKDFTTSSFTGGYSPYGTDVIGGGTVNPFTTAEYPLIEDWEVPLAGDWCWGQYKPESVTGLLPRGFRFYLFGDFNRVPLLAYNFGHDGVGPFYSANYNQSNSLMAGVPIKRSYQTTWNNEAYTPDKIVLLPHLVNEKYKLNNYGNEGYLLIESSETIPIPNDNSTGHLSAAGTIVGLVGGFGPYAGIKDYLHASNMLTDPEFYSVRLQIATDDATKENGNDFMVYTFDGDGDPIAVRDICLLKNVVKNQYKQLDGNEYIIVDTFLTNDEARSVEEEGVETGTDQLHIAETRTVFNGDVFVSRMYFKTSVTLSYGFTDFVSNVWENDYPDWAQATLLPVYGPMAPELQDRKGGVLKAGNYYFVESEINCNYRHFPVERDELGNIISHGVPYFPKQNKHKVLSPDAELGQSNGYNINYSHENDLRKFYLRPFGFEDVIEYPDRVIASEQQFEGEASDYWRQFFFNTYQDVPKNNGEITSLFVHRNTLYAHVERSLYRMYFNEATIVPSSSQEILLGNAGVFSRVPSEMYVVNNNGTHVGYCGSVHKFANVNTPFGRIIVDYYQKKVFLFTDTVSEISQNGLWKWWKNIMKFTGTDPANPNYTVDHINPFAAGILTIFDPEHKRVLIIFREVNEFYCRSFNLLNGAWVSLHEYDPHVAVVFDTKIITSQNLTTELDVNEFKVALHDSGNYGRFYTPDIKQSSITFVARPNRFNDKTFDNFEVFVEFYDHSTDRLVKPEFFNLMEFWSDHQYTGVHPIVLTDSNNEFNVNVNRIQNHYNIKTPLSITVDESQSIFDVANQDSAMEDKPRMRGTFLYGKFTYNNDDNYHFVLNYIFSIFRNSRR